METYGVDFIARCIAGEALDKASSGSGITVDSELSTTSENPVQNKVITNALNNVHIDVDAALSTTSENPVQNKVITAEVNSKPTCVTTGGAKVNGQKIMQLTKAQYDAIASKDSDTYYMITDDATDDSYTAGDGIDITNGVISLDAQYGASIVLSIDSSTYVLTATLKDQDGNTLGTAQTVDLPLESVVVGGSYNSQTQKVVLTLQNGNTIEFSVADLVYGLQTELSETNKLNPAYINYDSTHRAVSDTEKSEWNGKQDAIDSSHKLSADLVDDTGATNKFATEEELEQIQTNKNNISTLYKVGSANILKNTAQTQVLGGVTFTMNADGTITANGTKNNNDWLYLSTGNSLRKGTYVLSSGGVIGDDKLVIITTGESLGTAIMSTNTATGVYERELTQDYSGLYYAIRIANGTVCNNVTFKPMLCEKSVYEAINGEFQPYAMTNAEITAWQTAASGGLSVETDGTNYWITVNGIRLYFASSAPTGTIPDGSIGIGW